MSEHDHQDDRDDDLSGLIVDQLKARLRDAEDALEAIRSGAVGFCRINAVK